jgi:hypothetical protein
MNRILIPAKSAEDWKALLAEPEKQWERGYSARTLAFCWQEGKGFPRSVKDAFRRSDVFKDIEILLAIPEHQVPLKGGVRPSQNDIWVLARCGNQLVSIAVEGKVDEPFGPTLKDWGTSTGKEKRIRFICNELDLDYPLPDYIRYQLLHRTASAVLEAKRFTASHAVMLIHSFSRKDQWFDDYRRFVALFGGTAMMNQVKAGITLRYGISLSFGWVQGEKRYLSI